jgi:hypothetical protein
LAGELAAIHQLLGAFFGCLLQDFEGYTEPLGKVFSAFTRNGRPTGYFQLFHEPIAKLQFAGVLALRRSALPLARVGRAAVKVCLSARSGQAREDQFRYRLLHDWLHSVTSNHFVSSRVM